MNQRQTNQRQSDTNIRQSIINEDTRLSLKFSNVWPLLFAIVSTVALYFGLSMKIELLTQKVDSLSEIKILLKEHTESSVPFRQDVVVLKEKIVRLEKCCP